MGLNKPHPAMTLAHINKQGHDHEKATLVGADQTTPRYIIQRDSDKNV